MAIEFNCPHCGVLYKLKDELAGKTGKCKNPKCNKQILIPFRSTAAQGLAKPIDAEALAAQAYADEKPAVIERAPEVTKKVAVTCNFCDHKFEADASMGGKNSPCPECGRIIRIPKLVEAKPADWRTAATNRPSLAKSDEPVLEGVWDAQAKAVSGAALQKAGAIPTEDEEEPSERRWRRIKQSIYGLALLGIVVFATMQFMKSRREGKQEHFMDVAVKELETDGPKKPELTAAILRYAGEYRVRAAKNADDLQTALASFNKSRDHLQNINETNPVVMLDRNGMLVELGLTMAVCGGDAVEAGDGRRLNWDAVHPLIRKCLDKVPSEERELRSRSMRLLTQKMVEKEQPALAATIARNCGLEEEQPRLMGRVGIELFLLGRKEAAAQVWAKATPSSQPEMTALWLALHADSDSPPADIPHEPPPTRQGTPPSFDAVLAYAEGRALQGRMEDARAIVHLTPNIFVRVDALTRMALAAAALGKTEEAGKCLDDIAALIKPEAKAPAMPPWLLISAAELAAHLERTAALARILDAIPSENAQAWAKLCVLRQKLARRGNEKADESWLESASAGSAVFLAQALAEAEVARHNAAAGQTAYSRTVDALPKGTLRPFGLAGLALGAQDRALRK